MKKHEIKQKKQNCFFSGTSLPKGKMLWNLVRVCQTHRTVDETRRHHLHFIYSTNLETLPSKKLLKRQKGKHLAAPHGALAGKLTGSAIQRQMAR